MKASDRDYFMLRARQEHDAAAHATGAARSRHEELASSYRMRVMYIDRGLIDEGPDDREALIVAPVQQIIIAA
jgi:hypothetical protein